mgnify:CR=1 FL=1
MRIESCQSREGSSLRARGADERDEFEVAKGGIIPARAGSRLSMSPVKALSRDHPRARGAAVDNPTKDTHTRIIPARAGSRRASCTRASQTWDHPRARGEQLVE